MNVKTPRLVIAGLSGDSGKTIVSLSLLAAFCRKGFNVAPFKKGPDYIDPAWLSILSGNTCRNLDTYLVDRSDVLKSFTFHASKADISVIEGNRGLFDGKDHTGSHSTAGLAKLLQAPLLLVVNVTKSTRTVAALVKGCQTFDPDLKIAGVSWEPFPNLVMTRRCCRVVIWDWYLRQNFRTGRKSSKS
jgi:cobyrinic acid a,c-diamide synthase